jgi:hypothetical protein
MVAEGRRDRLAATAPWHYRGADRHHAGAAREGTDADAQTILTGNNADIRQQDSFVLFGGLLSAERLLLVFFGFCIGFSSHLCRAIGARMGGYRELRGVELTAQVVIRCNAKSLPPARLALRSCARSASTRRPYDDRIVSFKTNKTEVDLMRIHGRGYGQHSQTLCGLVDRTVAKPGYANRAGRIRDERATLV